MAFEVQKEMLARLDESARRFDFLTMQISQPEVVNNRSEFQKLSKERSDLETIANEFAIFKKNYADYSGAREILETEKDPDLRAMANADISSLEDQLTKQFDQLQIMLLPKDPNDDKNIIMEIRQGVGGDEAGLFVGDMYRAYQKYADKQRWKTSLMSVSENGPGGFREVIVTISGEKVYSKLKYEAGVHRVQRVPKTEAQGRIHTSTITVMVLPEAEEIDLVINPADLRIDVQRASGAGGQSVNTTNSAVRVTYIPTNEVVICQDGKSQQENKAQALKVLRSRILQKMREKQDAEQAAERKSQVSAGMRNERIRTYNFPQGRVTDHRIGMTTYNIDHVMGGDFEDYISALTNHYQTIALKGEGAVSVANTDDD